MSDHDFTKNDKRYLYAYAFNEENDVMARDCPRIDIRIYDDGQWEDKTEYNDWTDEEIESYNNSKYGEVMGMIEREEEEEELKCLGFRPQTRMGECAGCKAVCEECELLMIVETDEEFRIRMRQKEKEK